MSDRSVSDRMQARVKKNKKRYRFLATRMWINTAISNLWPDKGLIPKDIGDRLFIGNNVVITKNGLRGYIQIEEWSEKTPLSVTTKLTKYVKGKVPEVRVDVELRAVPYTPDLTDPAIKAQEKMWERALSDSNTSDKLKNRFARLLYSLERMRAGEQLFKVVTTFTFIAQSYTVLKRAIKIAVNFLSEKEVECIHVKTGVHMLFPFVALFMNREPRKTYALPWLVFSSQTLAESLPVTQGMNSDRGVFIGRETLINAGGIEAPYLSGKTGLNPNTEFANVYLSTRLLYETIIRDAGTSEPYAVREWANTVRGKNRFIAILCVGNENELESDYVNTNLWRPFG